MSRLMTKPTKLLCTQRRLRSAWAFAQSDQSLRCALIWVAKDPSFLHADSKDSDQTGWMPRLIWVFAGCTCHSVGFVMRQLICSSYGWWMSYGFTSLQQYFSHFETMEVWIWKALCNDQVSTKECAGHGIELGAACMPSELASNRATVPGDI